MDHHPHIHALVPGGGPALTGTAADGRWLTSKHPTQRDRRKPYLTDNKKLSRDFQEYFVNGMRRLIVAGKLRLDGEWAKLQHDGEREAWLDELKATAWNVFIEGPPNGRSNPEHVLKYLARYMSGGPIADRRLISDEDGHVTFWARTRDKENKPQPFTLRGPEFVRRWSMHILPKGYTRSRSYGGFHGSKRRAYLSRCRKLLAPDQSDATEPEATPERPEELPQQKLPTCVRCKVEMQLIDAAERPSWNHIFTVTAYRENFYCPLLHMGFGLPADHSIGGYG